ncbi:tetratricopeptide repeat protein [Leptospira sp. 'Mane']|uniref:tetratricopeptide repeat protein n=1 Tax=Leptospira sp. 'Mane' TaxID=3387407 RepID=UPI00398A6A85
MAYYQKTKLIIFVLIGILHCSNQEEALEHYQKGKEAYAKKMLEQAIEEFREASKQDKTLLAAKIMLGKSLYYNGDTEGAKEVFEETSESFPGNSLCFHWLGKIYLLNLSQFDQAKENFLQSIQLEDSNAENYYYLAKVYEKEGKWKEALLEYNKALILKKSFEKIHKDLGNLYLKAGEKERARLQFESIGNHHQEISAQEEPKHRKGR